jgi:hypothetical protein
MSLFSAAELTQRDRVYLIVCPRETIPTAQELAQRVPGEGVRRIDVRAALLDLLGREPSDRRLRADDILTLVHDALKSRGLVLFLQFALALAFFGDAERATLWRRLFSEVLDRPGLGILLLSPDSQMLPPAQVCERHATQVRQYLPATTCES